MTSLNDPKILAGRLNIGAEGTVEVWNPDPTRLQGRSSVPPGPRWLVLRPRSRWVGRGVFFPPLPTIRTRCSISPRTARCGSRARSRVAGEGAAVRVKGGFGSTCWVSRESRPLILFRPSGQMEHPGPWRICGLGPTPSCAPWPGCGTAFDGCPPLFPRPLIRLIPTPILPRAIPKGLVRFPRVDARPATCRVMRWPRHFRPISSARPQPHGCRASQRRAYCLAMRPRLHFWADFSGPRIPTHAPPRRVLDDLARDRPSPPLRRCRPRRGLPKYLFSSVPWTRRGRRHGFLAQPTIRLHPTAAATFINASFERKGLQATRLKALEAALAKGLNLSSRCSGAPDLQSSTSAT